jgi:hypothetical protein
MSNELLEKVIRTSEIGAGSNGGGLLQPVLAQRFIDYMWDATVLGGQVRTERLRGNEEEIQRIGVGERLMRAATEAVDDGINVGVAFTKVSITTKKLRQDWELSTDSLEDNIEGDALEDHIARLMTAQAGQDLEDVAINGDTRMTRDPLLKVFNGWRRLARDGGHVIDAGGSGLDRAVFNNAIKAMPRKYMQRRNGLKFFTGANLMQDYLYSLETNAAVNGYPTGLAGENVVNGQYAQTANAGWTINVASYGIPVQEVPLLSETQDGDYSNASGDHGEVWLTFPQNMIWGIKRDIQVYREFVAKKDSIEYTMYCRVGTEIENKDAFVVVKNVKVAS